MHSGRKLEWLYHLGHGEMVTHCFQRTYRIYSSTFQMGLLHQVRPSLTRIGSSKGCSLCRARRTRQAGGEGILVLEHCAEGGGLELAGESFCLQAIPRNRRQDFLCLCRTYDVRYSWR